MCRLRLHAHDVFRIVVEQLQPVLDAVGRREHLVLAILYTNGFEQICLAHARLFDRVLGDGTLDGLTKALLAIDAANGGRQAQIANAFQTDRFVPTTNDNYRAIEDVGVTLGLIER